MFRFEIEKVLYDHIDRLKEYMKVDTVIGTHQISGMGINYGYRVIDKENFTNIRHMLVVI